MSDAAATPVSSDEPVQRKSSSVSLRQLLLVPAIVVPLISAVPVWFDKGVAFWKDYRFSSAREAEDQIRIASRNITCLNAPYKYYQSTTKLSIDGTICKTGDVLVRVFDESNEGAIYWVPAELLKARIDYSRAKVSGAVTAAAPGLAPATWRGGAQAAYLVPAVAAGGGWNARPNPLLYYADTVTVLCSQKIDDRHIRQRIRRPDGCFDQVIDLANGAVVSLTPAPCSC